MPIKSKADLKGFPLRIADDERGIVEATQEAFNQAGLRLSLNDVIRHLIRRAELGVPRDAAHAFQRLQNHWASCEICEAHARPRCPDGVYLVEQRRSVTSGAPV